MHERTGALNEGAGKGPDGNLPPPGQKHFPYIHELMTIMMMVNMLMVIMGLLRMMVVIHVKKILEQLDIHALVVVVVHRLLVNG